MLKLLLIIVLSLTSTLSLADYKRADWPHWKDLDGDCQNARVEILIRDNIGELTYKTDRECKVISGLWMLPYKGGVEKNPRNIDIDHIIPLKWAHNNGGANWSRAQKKAFANDPENLLATTATANRQKGAKGPEAWIPFINRCSYGIRWQYLLTKYELNAPSTTLKAIESLCSY